MSDESLIATVQEACIRALSMGGKFVEIPASLFNSASAKAQQIARELCAAAGAKLIVK